MRRALAEVEHRVVDSFPDVSDSEELLCATEVAAVYGVAKGGDVALFEIGHELWP
jgi:hypothetical protein